MEPVFETSEWDILMIRECKNRRPSFRKLLRLVGRKHVTGLCITPTLKLW